MPSMLLPILPILLEFPIAVTSEIALPDAMVVPL